MVVLSFGALVLGHCLLLVGSVPRARALCMIENWFVGASKKSGALTQRPLVLRAPTKRTPDLQKEQRIVLNLPYINPDAL